jgi:hypothetical protein
MTITSLFPKPQRPGATKTYQGRHAAPYDLALDIVRKNSTVVPARHSSEPDTMRAVFPR